MPNVLTKAQHERIVRAYVELQREQDGHPERSGQYRALGYRLTGMSHLIEALLIDADDPAGWTEFDDLVSKINAAIAAARQERAA